MRTVVFPVLVGLGFDRMLLRRKHKTSCIINFHGVRSGGENPFNNRHIPVAEFEKILIYLKKRFEIVPLSTLFDEHRNKKKGGKKKIALTFDDGYSNNFNIALPLLKKHGIPATYYIITQGLEDADFYVWPDKVDAHQFQNRQDIVVDELCFPYPTYYNQETGKGLIEFLKSKGSSINSIVSSFVTASDMKTISARFPELFEIIRGNELAAFATEDLLEFGSHTHSHPNLEFLNKAEALKELKNSKELLEKKLGREVHSLAFPDGSYTAETIKLALEVGYKNQVAVEYKYNENNSHPNLLSRFTISNSTTAHSNIIRLAKDFDRYGID